MKVKQLRAALATMPDDAEVLTEGDFEPELSQQDGTVFIDCGEQVEVEEDEEDDFEEDDEDDE